MLIKKYVLLILITISQSFLFSDQTAGLFINSAEAFVGYNLFSVSSKTTV